MKYAWFPGCKIAHHLPEHGIATLAVCDHLGIELVKPEFSCCGYPVRHESRDASFFSALRNLALAGHHGLDLLTPCKCCYGNLMHARYRVDLDENLRNRMKVLLRKEGLDLPHDTRVRHLLQVLDEEVTPAAITSAVTRPLTNLPVACHYGCHALRPEAITRFDDPLSPTVFERLVTAIGATSVNWELRLECCGYPLRGRDDHIADLLMTKKLDSAARSGATILATACTYCQLQFSRATREQTVRPVLYPQLLGLALGLEPEQLGMTSETFNLMNFSQRIAIIDWPAKSRRMPRKSFPRTCALGVYMPSGYVCPL